MAENFTGPYPKVTTSDSTQSEAACIEKGYYRLKEENERLKSWIREEGVRNDTCTYDVLREICEGCRCKRQPQQNVKVSDRADNAQSSAERTQ